MSINVEMTELIKQVHAELMQELKRNKMVKPIKDSAFQKTEKLLYNYNQFKKVIEKKQEQIEMIAAIGLSNRSKSIVIVPTTKTFDTRTPGEKAEDRIEEIQASMVQMQWYIQLIDDALDKISADQYFDIIRLKYFEGQTVENISYELECDPSTVTRNKNRLVDILKIHLFPDDSIMELFD